MVASEFDFEIPRNGTASVKYEGRGAYFGSDDVIPLWIADMDFAAPPAVTRALAERAAHPIYGYTLCPDSLYDALIGWLKKRHGWDIRQEWILLSPGVVPSLHAAVMAFTRPHESVVIQPPVYHPFFSAVTAPGRRLALNPLRLEHGRYQMDYEGLERLCAEGARFMILCSPHNPVGRVWSQDELVEVLRIADLYGVTILSDEIHHDLVYPGFRHTPLAALADNPPHVLTAVAPSKTFNIPGLGLSALVVPDAGRRKALRDIYELFHIGASTPFGITAFEAAYRGGEDWLERLLPYLAETRDFVAGFLDRHAPAIKPIPAEGTYLLWLDCRELGMSDAELKQFFVRRARVGMNPGITFGAAGSGFMRLNIGAPRRIIAEALERIAGAL